MTLRQLPKVFCVTIIALFCVMISSRVKAEVYGYILTINVQADSASVSSGQEISKELAQSGSVKVLLKVIDPADPQKTLNVEQWDVSIEGIGASQWKFGQIQTSGNNYAANLLLLEQQIQTGAIVHAIAYVGGHQTNAVSFRVNVFKTGLGVISPTPVVAQTVESPIALNKISEISEVKVIPPLAMAVTSIVSMGVSASMSTFATALVVNGATPFIPSVVHLIFMVPFGFIKRRYPKWGKVLVSPSHEPLRMVPLELVMVEKDGYEQVVAKTYSDESGEYGFKVKPGNYKIRPGIPGAQIISSDGDFYKQSDLINVKDFGTVPSVNPLLLGSIKKTDISRAIYFSFYQSFQTTFFTIGIISIFIGTLLSLYVLFLQASTVNLLILALYLVLWGVVIVRWNSSRFSGKVVDKHTRLPIAFAVVRIMNDRGTEFVKGAVTNEKGEFTTRLRKGKYMVLSGKEGYRILRPKIFSTRMHSIGLIEMLPE